MMPASDGRVMKTDELDFDLPQELIAQAPLAGRGDSRLLHFERATGAIVHRAFMDLPNILKAGDVLVFNDARVLPARFFLRKGTGGRIEGLFLSEIGLGRWLVLLRNLGGAAKGMVLRFEMDGDLTATIVESRGEGEYLIEISKADSAEAVLNRVGRMPLPPYIKRGKESDERDEMDRERYQTIYAKAPGAVAAPTAGLHFSDDLLKRLDLSGIERVAVTLNVGLGTFKPVVAETLESHVMHTETYHISGATAEALNRAKREKRRIVAVGTTSARVLESQGEVFAERAGETNIFIHPPYVWKHVNALITNFHLPRSTLIALVAGFVGLEEQRRIYREAIGERYRFFSYGDAMLIE
jgi:S-adenosylmethionine:tRNA ribosyltransferase-isomerase